MGDLQSLGWKDSLEKGMATLFSILAWRIPWTEEPGRLQSMDFPGGSDSKESACNVGDPGSILGLERSPGEVNSYPVRYSGLDNSMDRIVNGYSLQRVR